MDTIQKRFNKFHKCRTRVETIKADIEFLKKCKTRKIFPNFIQITTKIKNNRALKAIEKAKSTWLKLEIRFLYAKLQNYELKSYDMNLELN